MSEDIRRKQRFQNYKNAVELSEQRELSDLEKHGIN